MKTFRLWFEIYGKKLKVETDAPTEAEARSKVRNSIKFHKVEEVRKTDIPDFIEDIFKNFGR